MKAAVMLAPLLLLAGCSDGPADSDGDGKLSAKEVQAEAAQGGSMAMRPGQWEIVTAFSAIEMPGMPAEMKAMMLKEMGKGTTVRTCLTKEQAEKPNAEFFGAAEANGCTYDKFDRDGGHMEVAMTCKGPGGGTMKNSMSGDFAADSYRMTTSMAISGGQGAITMKGSIDGRRTGDCAA